MSDPSEASNPDMRLQYLLVSSYKGHQDTCWCHSIDNRPDCRILKALIAEESTCAETFSTQSRAGLVLQERLGPCCSSPGGWVTFTEEMSSPAQDRSGVV